MANAVARQTVSTRPKDIGNLTFEGKKMMFLNFSGVEGPYNEAGVRSFCLVLEPEEAQAMEQQGWNIKSRAARDEGDPDVFYVNVAVSYRNRPPRIVLITKRGRTTLPEDLIGMLDWANVEYVDCIINPYSWAKGGGSGIKAYLKSIYVIIAEDELERKYNELPDLSNDQLELPSKQQLELEESFEYADVVED